MGKKTTETEYYRLVADNESRRKYFTVNKALTDTRRKNRAELIAKNHLFIDEPIFARELKNKAGNILSKYAIGIQQKTSTTFHIPEDLHLRPSQTTRASVEY